MALEKAQLGPLGWFYIGFEICWNLSLVAAMAFLWRHRDLPSIRMRKLPLLFTGVGALHVYGAISIWAYPFGAYFPCTVIFWMMSILVPFGMAMFQAANTQFLHVASRQKQLAHMSTLRDHKPISEKEAASMGNNRLRRIVSGVERADRVGRSLVFIAIGMVLQVAVSLLVFLGSEKFHLGWGLWDYNVKGTEAELYLKCNQGWEWWASIVWQFVWAWIYAPYMIWKSRGIRDVHGWRLQTICCCIAGLPASPLWLAGLYSPSMAVVGAYVPPPIWFGISIFLMEIITLGFPIVGVFKAQSLRRETLEAIDEWEKRQALNKSDSTLAAEGSIKDGSVYSDTYSKTTTLKSGGDLTVNSLEPTKSGILTMTALENTLRTNASPLLEFAALKDFSGENVSFLTHVADWRRYWFTPKASTANHRRQQFIAATHIYARFISLEFSEFPINISSREMKRLYMIFDSAAVILYRNKRGSLSSETSDSATPFDNIQPDDVSITYSHNAPPSPTGSTFGLKDLDTLGRANLRAVSRLDGLYSDEKFAEIEVPDAFAEVIFDAAESEIKYLVLTNTWPKFVNAGRAASQTSNDAETGNGWKQKVLCDRK
ncbi:hypothetical protein OPT61_g316 [Boeremia exigua]|uniref:Uncharacterized protein n=1 Tax=Boeremia exigua TaxID=749465 RepID=A0ACC2IUC8_9PLEO|nr:hypothetical protein OPT61_g316 [Boeremia exigua]